MFKNIDWILKGLKKKESRPQFDVGTWLLVISYVVVPPSQILALDPPLNSANILINCCIKYAIIICT